ncbi:hypothetical protein M2305_000067 [Gluconobacter cerinus]|uniref:hypothetical protein n=1 Tax=Gluconobacter cerinus TaxID=38307 RepID=UPI0022266558|nr:hypothetical protein [Gluconobacter cerinus]MCW2264120.1 hypothetical protein [Gluconobacter cerinus]
MREAVNGRGASNLDVIHFLPSSFVQRAQKLAAMAGHWRNQERMARSDGRDKDAENYARWKDACVASLHQMEESRLVSQASLHCGRLGAQS